MARALLSSLGFAAAVVAGTIFLYRAEYYDPLAIVAAPFYVLVYTSMFLLGCVPSALHRVVGRHQPGFVVGLGFGLIHQGIVLGLWFGIPRRRYFEHGPLLPLFCFVVLPLTLGIVAGWIARARAKKRGQPLRRGPRQRGEQAG